MVFLPNHGFEFLHKGHNQKFYTYKRTFFEISGSWFFMQQIPDSPKNRSVFFYWPMSKFKLIFLFDCQPNFFQKNVSQKHKIFAVKFNEILNHFNHCLRILIVRIIQMRIKFWFISKFNVKYHCEYQLNYSLKVSSTIFTLGRKLSVEVFLWPWI